MSVQISIPNDLIAAFCRQHRIRKLSFFGSVLRGDFTPDSDVDVLVEFEPGTRVGLITLAGIEIELSKLFGRRVELHTMKGLNPLFRDDVLATAEVQYEHA
jgi:predicted nucleotidyltransferase